MFNGLISVSSKETFAAGLAQPRPPFRWENFFAIRCRGIFDVQTRMDNPAILGKIFFYRTPRASRKFSTLKRRISQVRLTYLPGRLKDVSETRGVQERVTISLNNFHHDLASAIGCTSAIINRLFSQSRALTFDTARRAVITRERIYREKTNGTSAC